MALEAPPAGAPWRLDGKVALVTGASSGLGARFVRVLHDAGADVVATARRADVLSELASRFDANRFEIMAGDIACSSDEPSLAARTTGPIQVAAGQTTAGNVALQTAGEITGLVRGTAGQPVAGICAEAVPLRAGLGIPAGVTVTGGTYRIGDLQPGRYQVRFTSGCGATGYAARWYKNVPARAGATVVVVRPARVTAGINVYLHHG